MKSKDWALVRVDSEVYEVIVDLAGDRSLNTALRELFQLPPRPTSTRRRKLRLDGIPPDKDEAVP